jgi:formylglycine-generating enzyme required for sulfatase activity/predicted Ser/Thr protein kinase
VATAEWTPPEELDEYRIVRLLGEGAIGRVYLAEDLLLRRAVALKLPRHEPNERQREQFFVEARAAARLSHPNVVAIHRVGELSRRPFIVTEYVRGTPLDQLERPVGAAQLSAIAIGLGRGLAAAHRRGVLHRDLKPANAILGSDGEVKLVDFGMAKLLDDARGGNDARAGTPRYLAPELWRCEPATRQSDLYALGVLLFELAAARPPYPEATTMAALEAAVRSGDPPALASLAPELPPSLAAAIDRCLAREPAARFASAEALLDALEAAAPRQRGTQPVRNPYRGLARFDAEHRALFFGRDREARELCERLRAERFVLVVGDSGVGKSSLCAAGVLPLAAERAGWRGLWMAPGRRPLAALAGLLAPVVNRAAAELEAELRADSHALAVALNAAPVAASPSPIATLICIDQLEELLTVADPDEAQLTAEALGQALARVPQLHLLATARSDFLGRLATLPGLGDDMGRALHLLRPLSAEGMREAIVGPAATQGVRFESEALVESLISAAHGGLPFLQFALAELWEARPSDAGVLTAQALETIGGVDGALARHADRLLERLLPDERTAARRLLISLVTSDGTRARLSGRELVADGDRVGAAALEALVRGRLVLADLGEDDGGAYQLAHESLLSGWDTLRGWLAGDAELRAIRQRLARAAAEWERLARPPEALYTRRQLAETARLDRGELGPREQAFVAQSQKVARRRTLRRFSAIAGLPTLVLLGLGAVWTRARRELDTAILARTAEAERLMTRAHDVADAAARARTLAFARFDAMHWPEGEEAWVEVLALEQKVDELEVGASTALEGALTFAGGRASVRNRLADVIYARILSAEAGHREGLVAELRARLASYDADGTRRARLEAPARIELAVTPADATVQLERLVDHDGHIEAEAARPVGTHFAVAPGSYLLSLSATGRAPVRLPFVARRDEALRLVVDAPPARAVPEGFVYVPAGRFWFGSADAEPVRQFYGTTPLYEVSTPAYLIARDEVTFADWIAYLEALPPDERRRRTPMVQSTHNALELRALPSGGWQLALRPTTHTYEVQLGETIHYAQRTRRAVQDWTRFPVAAVSFDDVAAYAAWLDATGRLPGARLCDEHEWERAARGADARPFPSGTRLAPDDANIDVTYARQPLGFGPDAVGSHPRSRSPFGVDDMAGNVWEWVRSVARPGEVVHRGGSWYQGDITSRVENREVGERTQRHPLHGARLCATPRDH